jgi:5'-3' exoribonuclease 1
MGAVQAERKARRLGEDILGLFDSNCITPGTPFMARLDQHIKFFIRSKMARDPEWNKIRIVLSGYDVPGEGEHKIMEFIRLQVVSCSTAVLHFERYVNRKGHLSKAEGLITA